MRFNFIEYNFEMKVEPLSFELFLFGFSTVYLMNKGIVSLNRAFEIISKRKKEKEEKTAFRGVCGEWRDK